MVELVTVNKSANGRYYGRWEQRYDYTHFIVRSDDPLPSQKLYTEKFSDAPSGKPSPAPGVYPSPLVVVHSLVVYVDSKKKNDLFASTLLGRKVRAESPLPRKAHGPSEPGIK